MASKLLVFLQQWSVSEAPELYRIELSMHISRQVFWKWLLKGEQKPEVEDKVLSLIWQYDMHLVNEWDLPGCLLATEMVEVAPTAGQRTLLAGVGKE